MEDEFKQRRKDPDGSLGFGLHYIGLVTFGTRWLKAMEREAQSRTLILRLLQSMQAPSFLATLASSKSSIRRREDFGLRTSDGAKRKYR